ncbi:F0F1 ATP synthase subunit B [Lactobacillus helveticus]|uniref:ATP synthase subunit b n=1 Tax=Lactobacillus helveticus TaxID=1587 RepID=A0A3Q8SUA3_LACHE|nr:F0F1 ATP synthase subunit B [Lactobacillus helveticus]AFR22357.1 F0F1 ATP synthase subunit B [Lactobacillus helveticus R0052]AZK91018.1 ATP synthase subunit b [Lactobacillus helveticus]MCJ2189365.1 F0F1 ATP synthase subunit B [Lactobacillus helveticus]MED7627306.1 ATP synthase F0 subunit B [Lactobacillus helveticus]MZR04859.1 F0F1 ATP synthase subunit B [Lactobacillus helveticus]
MTIQTLFAASHHIYLGNALWYLICFAILLLLIKHFAWGPVSDMVEKRRQKVINDLDSAASDRKKAEMLANEREAALKNSRQEATQILSDAKANAQKTGKEIVASAIEDAAAIRKKANEEAAKAKSDALDSARDQVADISVAIAEKVIAKNLSAEDQKDLVDQFIKGLDD